jgi:hypothetical protein
MLLCAESPFLLGSASETSCVPFYLLQQLQWLNDTLSQLDMADSTYSLPA